MTWVSTFGRYSNSIAYRELNITFLYSLAISVRICQNGRSVLGLAAELGNLSAVATLLAYGVPVDLLGEVSFSLSS